MAEGKSEDRQAAYKALVEDLKAFFTKYVVLPSEQHLLIVAMYVLHTWLFEAAHVTPYLWINGAKESGKTRLLELLGIVCRNPHRADDMTPPVMFKLIGRERPTLLWDEIDTVWSGSRNESKRRLVNTGYKEGGCAWREVARELKKFPTFCAKVLCGINNGFMPDTIASRCIPIAMKAKKKTDRLERFSEYAVSKSVEVDDLLSRIMILREEAFVDVSAGRPEPLGALGDRQNEIVEPLLAIAAVIGIEQELRVALQAVFAAQGVTMSPQQVIFGKIRDAFGDSTKIETQALCVALGPSYNGRQLAMWLEPFGIKPKDIRFGPNILKGYQREDFDAVFSAYLPPEGLRLVEGESGDVETIEGKEQAA